MKEMQFPQKKKSRKTNERRADKNAAGQRAQPEPERPVVHAPQKDEDFEAIPLPPPFCSVKKIVFAASGEGGGAKVEVPPAPSRVLPPPPISRRIDLFRFSNSPVPISEVTEPRGCM